MIYYSKLKKIKKKKINLPIFIHIGMGKAASTTLQSAFQMHPEIYYNSKIVGGFYENYNINSHKKIDLFKCIIISDERIGYHLKHRIFGAEIISFDLNDVKKIIKFIKKIQPSAKILIVEREIGEEFKKSCYDQFIRTGYLKSYKLFTEEAKSFFENIKMVERLFAKEFQVIKVDYNTLRNNKNLFYEEISKILKINVKYFNLNLTRNKKLSQNHQILFRFFNLLVALVVSFISILLFQNKPKFKDILFFKIHRRIKRLILFFIY